MKHLLSMCCIQMAAMSKSGATLVEFDFVRELFVEYGLVSIKSRSTCLAQAQPLQVTNTCQLYLTQIHVCSRQFSIVGLLLHGIYVCLCVCVSVCVCVVCVCVCGGCVCV